MMAEYWEIEDIGVHAHIKVQGSEDDMIGLGFPVPLAKIIVDRHNKALDELIASQPMDRDAIDDLFYQATKRLGW
jgi:hypothetical protein